ncbi:hypothetical protein K474DRAFT_1683508 [Panus rudis PR-1116 ss-1]|nr:hypothetical protein K474DRAFT_1683508 [Panus rudis PR-1116 ss-1]
MGLPTKQSTQQTPQHAVWWSNAIFFTSVHIAALVGVYHYPWYAVHHASLALCFFLWQAACFGITIGYHRLYSHRAFRAGLGVRVVLATLGASAFQGSIKWWCLRHRLHHRFTDDPIHDPYCATRGLLWSHMGWIFFKPKYEKMGLIERDDLDSDPVVRLQHEYYIPAALLTGFVLPWVMGYIWGDPIGSFVWASLVARLMIWHCTFLVNSLAHWDGIQPYSDENTSRTNLLLALLTCGEGNHNFHAFPHDFRSGPDTFDWDPSKWIIIMLHKFGWATGLRTAREADVADALVHMHNKTQHLPPPKYDVYSSDDQDATRAVYEKWSEEKLYEYIESKKGRCVVVLKGYVVDVTNYLGEHPGGAALLRKYSVRSPSKTNEGNLDWKKASWAFEGGLNQHSRAAKRQMREYIVARLQN